MGPAKKCRRQLQRKRVAKQMHTYNSIFLISWTKYKPFEFNEQWSILHQILETKNVIYFF